MSPALNLVIPGIGDLLSRLLADARAAETLPGFHKFFTRASRVSGQPEDPAFRVAELLDVPRAWAGQFPHASYSRYAEKGFADNDVWLNLSPVSYVSASSGLILHALETDQISRSETTQLSSLLNSDSASDNQPAVEKSIGLSWRVNAGLYPDIRTTPLYQVTGRPVISCMPRGSNATFWAKTLAEWEMMLHSSGLNQQRVARGLPEISSFWLWGEGRLPDRSRGDEAVVLLTDDVASKGMARFHQVRDCDFNLGKIEKRVNRIVAADFSLINSAVLSDRMLDWLTGLDENWTGRAIQSLQRKSLASFSIIDPVSGLSWHLKPKDLKKFWRNTPCISWVL